MDDCLLLLECRTPSDLDNKFNSTGLIDRYAKKVFIHSDVIMVVGVHRITYPLMVSPPVSSLIAVFAIDFSLFPVCELETIHIYVMTQ